MLYIAGKNEYNIFNIPNAVKRDSRLVYSLTENPGS